MTLGVDIGGTKMLIGFRVGDDYQIEKYKTGKETTIDQINNNINNFINRFHLQVERLSIAIPGLIHNGVIEACDVIPGLEGVTCCDFYNGRGVTLINDIDGALNYFRCTNRDVKNFVVIMIGTGIGMSVIINGQPLSNFRKFCGELGYSTVVTPWGPDKLDNIASGTAIISRGSDRETIKIASTYMGYALNNIITTFSPEKIFIGGGVLNYPNYFENMVNVCKKSTLLILYSETNVVKEDYPGESVIRGLL